jgi:hypothetical protein
MVGPGFVWGKDSVIQCDDNELRMMVTHENLGPPG